MEKQSKICPRCKNKLICQSADIINCFCNKVKISSKTQESLAKHYGDCLCNDCLLAIEKLLNPLSK